MNFAISSVQPMLFSGRGISGPLPSKTQISPDFSKDRVRFPGKDEEDNLFSKITRLMALSAGVTVLILGGIVLLTKNSSPQREPTKVVREYQPPKCTMEGISQEDCMKVCDKKAHEEQSTQATKN